MSNDSDSDADKVSDLDDLERSIADEDRIDPVEQDVQIPVCPIVEEFGADGGVINVLNVDNERYFYVQGIAPITQALFQPIFESD